jgi:hypothetical protein
MDNTLIEAPQAALEVAHAELIRRFSSDEVISALVKQAVHEAVLDHKRVGNPVAARKDGKIVIIQPEDI